MRVLLWDLQRPLNWHSMPLLVTINARFDIGGTFITCLDSILGSKILSKNDSYTTSSSVCRRNVLQCRNGVGCHFELQ